MFMYIGLPYSHSSSTIRQLRIDVAAKWLQKTKFTIEHDNRVYRTICPLITGHYIDDETLSYDEWLQYDLDTIHWSMALGVLKLPGYLNSHGVDREVRLARNLNLPITYIDIMPTLSSQTQSKLLEAELAKCVE